ncbi:MAG TPA: hypothetical protein PLN69_04325 [bacterium]|nr:hypothetical protein [bacterium]
MSSETTEKLEILNMIKEGKITPEQGMRLMEALDVSESDKAKSSGAQTGEPKWLNIEMRARTGGKYKSLTPIRIPFSILKLFFRFIPDDSTIPGSGSNLNEILSKLKSGKPLSFYMEEGEEGRSIRIIAE